MIILVCFFHINERVSKINVVIVLNSIGCILKKVESLFHNYLNGSGSFSVECTYRRCSSYS